MMIDFAPKSQPLAELRALAILCSGLKRRYTHEPGAQTTVGTVNPDFAH